MIRIKKKKKNPSVPNNVKDILNDYGSYQDLKFLSEGLHGEIYSFIIKKSSKLNPGKYVIKLIEKKSNYLTNEQIIYLFNLSNHDLIPKIYFCGSNFIIMDYIDGKSLINLYKTYSIKKLRIIADKIRESVKIWHKLGFEHGDISLDNIIISNNKIYLIDPALTEYKEDDNRYLKLWLNEELGLL